MAELIVPLGSDEEEGGEDDDPSSFKTTESVIEDELERFRAQWQKELHIDEEDDENKDNFSQGGQIVEKGKSGGQLTVQDQAKYLFNLGVRSEQSGQFYDAIQYYRRAVQLVPDIEFRMDYKIPRRERMESESSVDSVSAAEDDDDIEDISNLIARFHRLKVNHNAFCSQEESKQETHISSLPLEVLNYIFKWVVSLELDIVSLENLAMVCRGFYVCARDEELWRLICQRIWGVNCGRPKAYGSWRNMFIERSHVRFNGCYISKMTYYRSGERGLDNFYKPYHLVEYYRYIRFFPEGQMLMLTTPDDPYTVVPRLQVRGCRVVGVLHGYYKMAGDQVTAVLKRRKTEYRQSFSYYKYSRGRQQQNQNESEQTFNVEFELTSVGKKPSSRLLWNHYSVHTIYKASGQESIADFELGNDKYPPLIFSRVKSYSLESNSPLE